MRLHHLSEVDYVQFDFGIGCADASPISELACFTARGQKGSPNQIKCKKDCNEDRHTCNAIFRKYHNPYAPYLRLYSTQ
jgi:hypothetical protein